MRAWRARGLHPCSVLQLVDGVDVDLFEVLTSKRPAIVDRWRDLALEVYPEDSARFMRREKDRFRNPVGHRIREGLDGLFESVVSGSTAEELRGKLDGIVRIRAVQQLSPSRAVGFVLLLKHAVREELGNAATLPDAATGLSKLDSRIDRLALQAFDLYVECREKIYELRLREIRSRSSGLFARMEVPDGPPEDGTGPTESRPSQRVRGGSKA